MRLEMAVGAKDTGYVVLNKGSVGGPEQRFEIKASVNKLKRYIVSAKWWSKWSDYTNFDMNDILLD